MGESAGAVSIQIHLQGSRILGLARAAVSRRIPGFSSTTQLFPYPDN